ncbi:Transcriptional regulator [Seminavis robusta]|uniref:Transcriptional regulator n=1 Tax=Seminavis robusta TaxID=568900 RepID=A0A9N8H267_9STRA|nr:Transcriptional regulator [Seminavis robusta]|eukprot:Sro4_g003650.1 Transcriptional regulator (1386) ;mRNA; f:212046-216290
MIDLMNRRLNRGTSHNKPDTLYRSTSVNSIVEKDNDDHSMMADATIDTADCTEDLTSSVADLLDHNTSLHLPNLYEDEEFDGSQDFIRGEGSTRSLGHAETMVANTKVIAPRGSMQQKSRNSMNAINQLKFSKLQKLYGRDQEIKLQRDLYVQAKQNSTRQFILIGGEAGVGKSVLAEELRPSVQKDCGFFLSGKFDFQQQDEPYSAISTACNTLMHSLMEHKHSRRNLHGWRFTFKEMQQKLCEEMDPDQIDLLSNIIPGLARVAGGDFLSMSNGSFAMDSSHGSHEGPFASERTTGGTVMQQPISRRRGMENMNSEWSIPAAGSHDEDTERSTPSERNTPMDVYGQPSSPKNPRTGMQKMASDWSIGMDSSHERLALRRLSSERISTPPRGNRRNGFMKRMASEWSLSNVNNNDGSSSPISPKRSIMRSPLRTTSNQSRSSRSPLRTTSKQSNATRGTGKGAVQNLLLERSTRHLGRMTSDRSLRGSKSASFTDTKACLHFAFRQLFDVLCNFAPTVFLLNDLQWADAASMELVESLLLDRGLSGKGFVLVGSYRSEAVSPTHLLMTTVREVQCVSEKNNDMNLKVTNIVLGNLAQHQVNEMLCDLLSCDEDECHSLAEIIHRKTAGNIFFVVHFLKTLSSENLLVFSIVTLKWTWDVERIELNGTATDNVIDLMKEKLKRLPAQVYRTIPFVACLGASFRRSMFNLVVDHFNKTFSTREIVMRDRGAEVYPPSDFFGVCQKAGFLVSNSKGDVIHWEHDKVQEAALSLADEDELVSLRSRLGEVLLHKLSNQDLERSIFVVISMLDMNSAEGNRRKQIRFAELNLLAGTKAMAASASARAAALLSQGIKCLPENHWKTDPDLSLDLYAMTVEALFCTGQFEKMNKYCHEVFQCKEIPLVSKARVYNPHVLAMMAEGRLGDAMKQCEKILAKLDCSFPRFFKGFHMYKGIFQAQKSAKKKIMQMSKDSVIEDDKNRWIMFILDTLGQAAHQGHNVSLFMLGNLRGLQYTLKYGVCDWAPPLLAVIGNVLVAGLGDFDGAQFYGETAMTLFEKADISRSAFSRTSFIVSYFVLPHRVASTDCRKIALQGYQAGMKAGDVQNALWCALSYLDISFYVSQDLKTLADDCQIYCQQMKSLKHERIARYLECLWQLVLNVSGSAEDPAVLNGNGLNYDEYMNWAKGSESTQAISYYDRYQIAAAFWSGDFAKVHALILKTDTHKGFYEKTFGGSFALYPLYFQCALSLLSLYQTTKSKKFKSMACFFSGKLNSWAKKGNPNFKHYSLMVDAEALDIRGKRSEAEKLFKEAVIFAGRRGFTNDQALANERLGGFFLRQGLDDDAKYHLGEAIKLYRQWGAHAKCDILHKVYEKLLPPIPLEIATSHGPG